jgi:protease-4
MGIVSVSCIRVKVNIGPTSEEDLKEVTLEGEEAGKVLVIPVRGFLSDDPKTGLLGSRPSTVQHIVSQLRLAEKDDDIKALLLEIDSPGGTVTASDILYHEIMRFKAKRGVKVVAAFLDVAASGGYYVAQSSDLIFAHPTSITGSVGVIFMTPKVVGLMDKLGVGVEVSKSGKEKDIGSPFRPSTPDERRIFQQLTDTLAGKFLTLVKTNRKLTPFAYTEIGTGRIYVGQEALELGLVDRIGYLSDALAAARELAGLPKDAKVVAYRRRKQEHDNLYNIAEAMNGSAEMSLIDLNLPKVIPSLGPGFYYLWLPAGDGR